MFPGFKSVPSKRIHCIFSCVFPSKQLPTQCSPQHLANAYCLQSVEAGDGALSKKLLIHLNSVLNAACSSIAHHHLIQKQWLFIHRAFTESTPWASHPARCSGGYTKIYKMPPLISIAITGVWFIQQLIMYCLVMSLTLARICSLNPAVLWDLLSSFIYSFSK